MSQFRCPSSDRLFAFSVGKLSDEESLGIADHVDTCGECTTRLDQFDDRVDPVAACFRQIPANAEYLREIESERLLTKLVSIGRAQSAGPVKTPHASSGPQISGDVIDAYRLLEKLGQGGMGTLYKALHPGFPI